MVQGAVNKERHEIVPQQESLYLITFSDTLPKRNVDEPKILTSILLVS